MSGKTLAEIVLGGLISLALDIRNCRGQSYDGAAAVSGHIDGLSAHICKFSSKAKYTHRHSHHLNLVFGVSCNIRCVGMSLIKLKKFPVFSSFLSPEKISVLPDGLKK